MRFFSKYFVLALFIFGCSQKAEVSIDGGVYDSLIFGGIVIDGTGTPGKKVDLLIRGDRIVAIGRIDTTQITVKEHIDVRGRVVTPGFIDIHAHGNPTRTPEFQNFTTMGITTIVLGQDGSSPGNISEWMKQVEEARPALNIATLIGHGTVRNQAEVKLNPNPSSQDLQNMTRLVEQGLEAGCFGLSTGLEYQPGSLANMEELVSIALPVGEHGSIVQSHLRSEDDDVVQASIAELIDQGERGKCAVHVSHIKVVYGRGVGRAEDILSQMDEARRKGIHITADFYPYTASYTGIGIVFPDWVKPPHNYAEVMGSRRTELSEYLRRRVNQRNGPESTLFGTGSWAGRTLSQIAEDLGKPFEDVLMDDIGPRGAGAAYFVMDQELQDRLIVDPHVMICSDGSPTMRHPRGYGAFAKVIRYYVRETQMLSLEEAIHKMTGLPAETMGLVDMKRGLLKPGFYADVLVFDPDQVYDKATYENPHQLAEGFDWIIVNGTVVRAEGRFTGSRGGMVLRRGVR